MGQWLGQVMLGMPDFFNGVSSFYYRAVWKPVFVWWPQRCNLTGQRIWLETAYQGEAMWTGPGTPVYEFRYHKNQEHLIWQLQQ